MRLYLAFWWHNVLAKRWKRKAQRARLDMIFCESIQLHHEMKWTAMKRSIRYFQDARET